MINKDILYLHGFIFVFLLIPNLVICMENKWKNDEELFILMKEKLFTAVVGDIMDQNGYLHQFLPPAIQP